jgi:hypothetical protein
LPHVAVGLIALPFIVSQNAWYEWSNTLWLLDVQTAHVASHALPTYFIDAPGQYFYPQYVFYAGPALSVLAYPSLLFGTWPVFAAVTAGAFGAASAGVSWTARNFGVPARLAIVPGVLFASTPYLVSDLYGRGAWTEIVAVGAFAVALGAATSITTGRARSPRTTVVVLALAVATVAGTHNLTLLFGALLALPLAIVLLPLLRVTRRELIRRHALVIAGALLGVALCGYFLVPDVWLAGRTQITATTTSFLQVLWPFESLGALLHPTNAQPGGIYGTDLHTQTLVAPLLWILIVSEVARWRSRFDRPTATTLTGLALLGVALTVLIVDPSWWLSLPPLLRSIQFTFRLVTFLALVTVLGVITLLTRPGVRGSRVAMVALVLVTGYQLTLAADLAITAKARRTGTGRAPTPASINAKRLPPAFQANLLQASEYRLITSNPVAQPATSAAVDPIGDDTPRQVLLHGRQAPGTLVATTVVASPLIRLSGDAQLAGATAQGFAVLRVNRHTREPWHATVTSVCDTCVKAVVGDAPLALLAGRLATLLGGLTLLGLLAYPLRRFAPRGRGRLRLRLPRPRVGGRPPSSGSR